MKKLDFSSAELKIYGGRKPGRILWLYPFFCAVMAISFWLASFLLYRLSEQTSLEQAAARSRLALDMAAESVAAPINGLRHSLSLIAKQPVLRDIQSRGIFQPALKKSIADFRLLAESFEVPVSEIIRTIINYQDTVGYLKETPVASVRTFLALPAFFAGEPFEVSEDYLTLPAADNEHDFAQRSGMADRGLKRLADLFEAAITKGLPLAVTLESFMGAGKEELEDRPGAENLLAVTLVDDQIKGLVLKSMSGDVLAKVGNRLVNTVLNDTRDCRAIQSGVPFYCGPVAHDRNSGLTLWWVAVPVRNRLREPVACLAALIDAGFLSRLAEVLRSSHLIKIEFVDSSGILIGGTAKEVLGSRLDHNNQLPQVKGQAIVHRRIRHGSVALLQAGRSVKNDRMRYLPDWNIFSETNLQVFAGHGQIIIHVCVFLLAASGMYAISCCFVQTLKFLNGD